jgi:hypothetical protein
MVIDFYEAEKIAIIVFALIMAYAEFAQAIKHKGTWIKWALGFMGLYWAGYYAYSLYRTFTGVTMSAHQIFVRSGIMLTLAFVAAGACMTLSVYKRIK